MRIVCSRRDDILKAKAEHEEYQQRQREQYDAFAKAQIAITDGIKAIVEDKIGPTTLDLLIDAGVSYSDMIQISVSDESNVTGGNKALSWRWSVHLDKSGDVVKDSSSWSGMNATTPEHIKSLKEVLRVLEVLNDIDWKNVLNVELPKYEDYVDSTPSPHAGRDFKNELFEADIEEAIGADVLLKGHGYKYYKSGATVGYKILSETPAQYNVLEVSLFNDNMMRQDLQGSSYRVKKSTFMQLLNHPLEIVEV